MEGDEKGEEAMGKTIDRLAGCHRRECLSKMENIHKTAFPVVIGSAIPSKNMSEGCLQYQKTGRDLRHRCFEDKLILTNLPE